MLRQSRLRGIVGQQIGSRFAPLGGCWLTSNWVCFSLAAWAQLGVSGVSTVQKCFSGEPLGTGETWVLCTEPPSLPPITAALTCGERVTWCLVMLMLHYVHSRGQPLQKATSPWRVKCCAYQQVLIRDESCSHA